MSACYPKYAGKNAPPYPKEKKRQGRRHYESYYLSEIDNENSCASKWIKGDNCNIHYKKPKKSSRKKRKSSRKKRKSRKRKLRRSRKK